MSLTAWTCGKAWPFTLTFTPSKTNFSEVGSLKSYRTAANRLDDTRELLYLLAETFPLARASLNRMTDRCLF